MAAGSWTEACNQQAAILQSILEQTQEQTRLMKEQGERVKEQGELMKEHQRAFEEFGRNFERKMEVALQRLNFIEWRSCLLAESQWSGLSLQASHKAWKMNCTAFPSRDGDDRKGGRGSPLEPEDERKGDAELPDERLIERASAFSWAEYGTPEPGAAMMRAEIQRLHAKRRTVEAMQEARLAEEAELRATVRMRELKGLMRKRTEPAEPAPQQAEAAEPLEDGEAEPAERGAGGAAAAAEEPPAPEQPAEDASRSTWC